MNVEHVLITSTRSPHVKRLRRLHRGRVRREDGSFLVEGLRLTREALDSGWQPDLILYDPEALQGTELGRDVLNRVAGRDHSYRSTSAVVEAAAATESPAGIVLSLPLPHPPPPTEILPCIDFVLVLDGIADAGNAGTILRSAAATGVKAVLSAPGTVDLFSPKVVRAAAGAHFRLHLLRAGRQCLEQALASFDQAVGADVHAPFTLHDIDWNRRTALVIGSEAHGLGTRTQALLTATARIPMAPGVESLNAAVAASIILFHARKVALALQN